MTTTAFHSGFVCLVGRPNTGKSTLTNALVGHKIAITSNRPQTTRHTIRGIIHQPHCQIILLDTPGLHKPRTLLGKRLNNLVRETYLHVDLIVMCLPADQRFGPGDQWILTQLTEHSHPRDLIVAMTKIDRLPRDLLAQRISDLTPHFPHSDIIPVSALKQQNLSTLIEKIAHRLPEGPQWYPQGELTDEPEETLMAEFIREAALEDIHDELPHSLAVVIEEVLPHPGRDDLLDVYAVIYVERDSQKGIIIGKSGTRLARIGTQARHHIEALLGTRIFLDLRVKVAKNWQKDPKQLARLGF